MVGPGAAGASKPGNLPVSDPGTVGPGVVAGGIRGARGAGATGGAGAGAVAGGIAGGGVMAGIVEGSRAEAGGSGKTRIRAGKTRQKRDICMCYPLNSLKRCLIDRTGHIKTAEEGLNNSDGSSSAASWSSERNSI